MQETALGARPVALYLTGMAAFVGLYLPQPILPLLARDFAVDAQSSALVVSATIFGIALAAPVIGVLSDRFGRRRLLILGSLLLAVSTAASAAAPSFELLVLFRFVQGLLLPTLFAVGVAYVSEALPAEVMRAVAGVYVAATVIGGMLGRVVAGVFADLTGWRFGFVLSAILYLLLAAVWGRLPAAATASGGVTLLGALRGTMGHLRNPSLVKGLLVGFCLFFAFQSTFNYLPFRLEEPPFSFSSTLIGLTYLTYVTGVFSSTFAGWFRRRATLRAGLLLGFGLAIAGNLLTLLAGLPLLLTGLLVLCFGNWLVHALAVGHVATVAENDRAGANSLYLLLYYLGGSLGAFLPGYLYPLLGYAGVISASVVALAAGVGATATMAPRRRTAAPVVHPAYGGEDREA